VGARGGGRTMNKRRRRRWRREGKEDEAWRRGKE
jgi:hypothetical protein